MKKSMKKTLAAILAAAMVLSAGTTVSASHGRGGCGKNNTVCDNSGRGTVSCKFVDKDKDGVCDTCGIKKGRFVDKNKDGKCDDCKNTKKNCHFVDDNRDGVCDNKETKNCGQGKGNAGKGCGRGNSGKGCGRR